MIIAGGTGGHVFPGLAVAHCLRTQGWKIRWLGTSERIEATLVPQHGIDIDFIRIRSCRGNGIKAYLITPICIFQAIWHARHIIRTWKPDVVLGMGGYVSGPGSLAAWMCNIPVVLHEQNRIAGFTNRVLSKIACKVLQAFPGAFPYADVVGNPIRDEVLALPEPKIRMKNRSGPIRVLVIGGSQGAQILNQIMPLVAANLSGQINIWHQVGKGALDTVTQAYKVVGGAQKHKIVEFINDMASAYAWADVVVCRSGALTVSEISTVGLAAIFVPFIHKDRQQYWNARVLEKIGAAKIIEQKKCTAAQISHILSNWDRTTLLTLAQRARATAIFDSAIQIAREITLVI